MTWNLLYFTIAAVQFVFSVCCCWFWLTFLQVEYSKQWPAAAGLCQHSSLCPSCDMDCPSHSSLQALQPWPHFFRILKDQPLLQSPLSTGTVSTGCCHLGSPPLLITALSQLLVTQQQSLGSQTGWQQYRHCKILNMLENSHVQTFHRLLSLGSGVTFI